MTLREFEGEIGMDYGVGFDAISSEVCGDGIVRTTPVKPLAQGQEVTFKLREITSSSQLTKELDISASASLKAAFGRGSAKASYVSKHKVNQYSIFLLVQVQVTNPTQQMRDVKLTDEAWKLLENGNDERFRERFGDEFLRGITTGGEYLGILEIQASSQEEQNQASLTVRGKGGIYSGSAEFRQAIESIAKQYEMSLDSFQQGGNTSTIPKTVDDMITHATTFPQQVSNDDKAFPYLALFADYKTLDLPPGKNPIDVQAQHDALERLANYRMKYTDILNSIEYVLFNANQFEAFDSTALSSKANELRKTLDAIDEAASSCFNSYKNCKALNLQDPVVSLPNRKSATVQGAIKAARDAANNAIGFANDAKAYAQAVLDVLNTIAASLSGKEQADQAKVKADQAAEAAKLAQQEADKAIIAQNTTDEAKDLAKTATDAAGEAKQAADVAHRNADEAFKIGYAPYWIAPRIFAFNRKNPFTGEYRTQDFGMNLRPVYDFETFVFDPLGGRVVPFCTGSLKDESGGDYLKNEICTQANYTFTATVKHINGLDVPYPNYSCFVPNPEKAPSKTITLTLKSEKSGFTSSVELQLMEKDQIPNDGSKFIEINSLGGVHTPGS